MAVRGRPSLYSEEMAERICEGLREGMSLVKICSADNMPGRATVMRWWCGIRCNADSDSTARGTAIR